MVNELNPQWSEKRAFRVLLLAPFVLVALYAGYLWAEWKKQPTRPTEVTWQRGETRQSQSIRELTLFYPGSEGKWSSEQRMIRGFETVRQELRDCVKVYLEGPTDPAAYLPGDGNLAVHGILLDGRGNIYLDLSHRSRKPLNVGGIQGEFDLIQGFSRTVHANYPEFTRMFFLINGNRVNTLAGHIDVSQGISL